MTRSRKQALYSQTMQCSRRANIRFSDMLVTLEVCFSFNFKLRKVTMMNQLSASSKSVKTNWMPWWANSHSQTLRIGKDQVVQHLPLLMTKRAWESSRTWSGAGLDKRKPTSLITMTKIHRSKSQTRTPNWWRERTKTVIKVHPRAVVWVNGSFWTKPCSRLAIAYSKIIVLKMEMMSSMKK